MPDKFFPIKTDTACQLKWTWSTIQLYSGATNSCHRVGTSIIDPDNFDSFHNTEKKLQDRKMMLEGQWPTGGCEYCQNIEKSGGQSDRQFHLQIPSLVPPELDVDPIATHVTPRILEVYLDNVCNMSCVYCWDGFSSRIQQENIKFGDFASNGIEIKNTSVRHPEHKKISDAFWHWMEENYQSLRRFHLLGGEPFFQPQFETCLEFLETHHNPELEFNIVSNLKVPASKLQNFVERVRRLIATKRIKRFDLTCSIDCWGQEQEYIRYGIDLSAWKQNFEYIAKQKWIVLNINQTITGIGIKSMPELIDYVNQQRKDRTIGHYFMACVNISHLYPGIFGAGFFDKDFERILAVMPNDTWQHKQAYNMMQGLQSEFNVHSRNNQELLKLRIFLDEIDRRRNLDWKQTFPWLVKELTNVV
jgi:organic radical activating enzyme